MARSSMISFKSGSPSKAKLNASRHAVTARKIPYKVYMDGVDVTPYPLMENPSLANLVLGTAAALTTGSAIQDIADYLEHRQSKEEFYVSDHAHPLSASRLQQATAGAVAGLPSLTAISKLDESFQRKSSSFESLVDTQLGKKILKTTIQPEPDATVSFMFHETDFLDLFDLPSETSDPTIPDYENEVRDRERFVAERAAIKTRSDAILQTTDLWVRTRWTQQSRILKRNQHTMATTWDIWDAENSGKECEDGRAEILRKRQIRKLAIEGAAAYRMTHKSVSVITMYSGAEDHSTELSELTTEEQSNTSQFLNLFELGGQGYKMKVEKEFKYVAMVIERLLLETSEAATQRLYLGIPPQDPLDPDIRYFCEPKILWTFETEHTKERCVTCIEFTENPCMFAVGYGRYYFSTTNPNGMVKIWSIKNPIYPERSIRVKSPVTACAFSKRHPNLIAIGLINGRMALVDIANPDCQMIYESPETGEPIWSVTWLQRESQREDEILLAGTQDGRILRFQRSEQFQSVQMMRVARNQGSIRGISRVNTASPAVPCSQFTAILTICECPTEADGYLVGTDDGCLHICSTHYLHRHLAASACHVGPIYSCQVSPFIDKVYLTCGADWTIRIWAQGIHEPLLTFSSSMEPVEGAVWCPKDSCLVASISGKTVSIWDMRRKIIAPAGTATSPTEEKFSAISWAKDGSLLVGDRSGVVQVMKVEGLPMPSFFQERTLANALSKVLKVTKPDLFASLKKLGKPF